MGRREGPYMFSKVKIFPRSENDRVLRLAVYTSDIPLIDSGLSSFFF